MCMFVLSKNICEDNHIIVCIGYELQIYVAFRLEETFVLISRNRGQASHRVSLASLRSRRF